ncbi:TIGR02679 domain-containing protein [Lacticaseibacillus kribbianus]|uniref:TIGR02679 domain-containing protein n=1 Tax=Lacticaseibacillus kribbianus TaxID=2926292 RepID=UPI001CD1FFF0|nr:TIGR02679 domain-containing protein [Lacticaseibacillus kribbianus]
MATLSDARAYFQSAPALQALMAALAKRYRQYGEFKGKVAKASLNPAEPVMSFLGVSATEWTASKTLDVALVLRAYDSTAFATLPLTAVVAAVTGKPLITNEAARVVAQSARAAFDDEARRTAPHVAELLRDGQLGHYYRSGELALLRQGEAVWQHLPTQPTALPLFAYQQTGNPHALDRDRPLGALLLKLLAASADRPVETAADQFERYLQVNLVPDSVLNFVTVQNLTADSTLFEAAAAERLVWNVPMMSLLPLASVRPVVGSKVFLIENSSVFAILSARFPALPMVMTSGQYSAAVWALLARLPESSTIYYASDLDAAGLGMANRLWHRYPHRVRFFGMAVADLEAADQSSPIDVATQIIELKNITAPPLLAVRHAMVMERRKVFQEAIIARLAAEIERINGSQAD